MGEIISGRTDHKRIGLLKNLVTLHKAINVYRLISLNAEAIIEKANCAARPQARVRMQNVGRCAEAAGGSTHS